MEKSFKIKPNTALIEKPHKCVHCNSAFVKESTMIVHMCEQKRRHLAKNERHVRLAFQVYHRFYQLTQNMSVTKSYDDFAKSPFYNAFVKFGSFLSNVNPLYPDRYIDYVVTSGAKLDNWCQEQLYYRYVLDLIKTESVETALERSINTMLSWAETNSSNWTHYFKYASANRVVYDIKDGKISPWIVLNCVTGRNMLAQFNDEQLAMVFEVMDPAFWSKRFQQLPADLAYVQHVAAESSL